MNEKECMKMIEWLIVRMTEWMVDCINEWMTDRETDRGAVKKRDMVDR